MTFEQNVVNKLLPKKSEKKKNTMNVCKNISKKKCLDECFKRKF